MLSAGPLGADALAALPALLAAAPGGPGGGHGLRELSLSFAPARGFTAADLAPLGQCAANPVWACVPQSLCNPDWSAWATIQRHVCA